MIATETQPWNVFRLKTHPKYLKLDSVPKEDKRNIIKVMTIIKIKGIKKAFLYSFKKFKNFSTLKTPSKLIIDLFYS